MDQQVPTEASAEVGMLIHPPETDIFLSGSQNWHLIIFLAPTFICLRLKRPPDLFRNQLTSQITPLQDINQKCNTNNCIYSSI